MIFLYMDKCRPQDIRDQMREEMVRHFGHCTANNRFRTSRYCLSTNTFASWDLIIVDTDRNEFSYHDFISEISSDDFDSDSDFEDALESELKDFRNYCDENSWFSYGNAPFDFECDPVSAFSTHEVYDMITNPSLLKALIANLRPTFRRFKSIS